MAIRVIISDTDAGHAADVKDAISFGYGSDISAEIEVRLESFIASLVYAVSIDAIAVVRSTDSLTTFVAGAEDVYPDIQCFVPLGSNGPIEITNPTSVPVIVTCGAGDTDNDTAYGPGLEFWDDDNDGNPNNDASSFSNGTICGKLLKIKDERADSWWDARYAARETASGGGSRTDADGYGQIDTAGAIAYAGTIITDPYLAVESSPTLGSENMPSRAEIMRDQWVDALAEITPANGYNNLLSENQVSRAFPTLAHLETLIFPHVALELGDSRLILHDSTRTVNDELITMTIQGYVKVDTETAHIATASKVMDAMEPLVNDLEKKICTDLLTVNARGAENAWNVELRDNRLKFQRVNMLGLPRNIGMIRTELVVRIRNQKSNFGFVGFLQDQEGKVIFDQAGYGIEMGGSSA